MRAALPPAASALFLLAAVVWPAGAWGDAGTVPAERASPPAAPAPAEPERPVPTGAEQPEAPPACDPRVADLPAEARLRQEAGRLSVRFLPHEGSARCLAVEDLRLVTPEGDELEPRGRGRLPLSVRFGSLGRRGEGGRPAAGFGIEIRRSRPSHDRLDFSFETRAESEAVSPGPGWTLRGDARDGCRHVHLSFEIPLERLEPCLR